MEAIHEQRDLLRDILVEVMEDQALAEAIHEGETTEEVSRYSIFQTARRQVDVVLHDVP
ncbi:MAG: hypothetical protein M3220_04270 [Chloroflexota bacterium]|nr:hypothetical protein [Chloroflexota bacterium]